MQVPCISALLDPSLQDNCRNSMPIGTKLDARIANAHESTLVTALTRPGRRITPTSCPNAPFFLDFHTLPEQKSPKNLCPVAQSLANAALIRA